MYCQGVSSFARALQLFLVFTYTILVAVYRYYESRWRIVNAVQPSRKETVEESKRTRSKYVKPGIESEKWNELLFQFMTEETGGVRAEEITRQ